MWAWIVERCGELMRSVVIPLVLPIVEHNLVPDFLIRWAIRRELEMVLLKERKLSVEAKRKVVLDFVEEVTAMGIAIEQHKANEQHYEVPDEFYQLVLGPYLKYSSGYWPSANTTLPQSEIAMLELYCERAGIVDGMRIIDLGCGWGSVTLFMAQKYPRCSVTAISNSNSQREYITATAKIRGLNNVAVFTGDIAVFDLPAEEYFEKADRVVSIEMFEHMKNYGLLMNKISNWLKPGGKLFVHIFTSVDVPGHYKDGWMTETFFSGGTLPSNDLLLYFQNDLRIEQHWCVSGTHYQRTLEGWLQTLDAKKNQAMPILARTYGEKNALKWFVNWRIFFMACAEFFGMRGGQAYIVSHYLFRKP